jgi:AAA+ superfamily predicted ATPase
MTSKETKTDNPISANIDFEYLQAEMARIDVSIRREVYRWRKSGQNPEDNFRGLYVSDADADALLERPLGYSWGQTTADAERDRTFEEALRQSEKQRETLLEGYRTSVTIPRLLFLADTFQFDQVDRDIFLICLAPYIDLRYERIYGYLQDDVTRKRPTINLVLDLLGDPGLSRYTLWEHFSNTAPLFKEHILEKIEENEKSPGLNHTLHVDETIVSWLLGVYQPSPGLGFQSEFSTPNKKDTDIALLDELITQLSAQRAAPQTFIFHGPDQAGQRTAAQLLASQENRPLLTINLAAVQEEGLPLIKAIQLGLRDAKLTNAIPLFRGWDVLVGEDSLLPGYILAVLNEYKDTIILAGRNQWQASGLSPGNPLMWMHFDIPSFEQRITLWRTFLDDAIDLSQLDLEAIAGQFLLTTEQIHDAGLTAQNSARQQNRDVRSQDIFSAARAYSNHSLSKQARKINTRYSWEDIILPDDQVQLLREIISTVRGRPVVLEKWGVGEKLASSSGVAILFDGPPGTGKTMAAEIIASELNLDLYKIDLSTVVSKYIGETEKNISQIFKDAETSNAILFFDEADALFGKRSEVRDSHDRYANIEISYLLQRMEAYNGVTILATNLRANLDEAFTRRLQFVVTFPFPDEASRLRIWETLFPPGVPHEKDIDLESLARRYKLAGGNIRNILVNAAYLAAADGKNVSITHLQHSIFRELQKMRRLVDKEDVVD